MGDLKRLAAFAASRNVRLVVEVDVPAHTGRPIDGNVGWCLPYPGVCPSPTTPGGPFTTTANNGSTSTTQGDGGALAAPAALAALSSPPAAPAASAVSVPRCHYNALNPASNLTYAVIDDIVRELSAALPDAFLHFGGDEVLQEDFPPHDCWERDPAIATWLNATFSPPGRDPRGYGGAVAYFNDKVEAIARKYDDEDEERYVHMIYSVVCGAIV